MGRSDQGAYYCEADNGLGQAGKAELQVKKIQISMGREDGERRVEKVIQGVLD